MGAWGSGLLENDAALDLLGEVGDAEPADRTALLEARLRAVADAEAYVEGPDVDEALVAALLVLVAAGGQVPSSAGPLPDLVELPRPAAPLLALTGRALARAADPEDNEWLELWDEAGEGEQATARVRELASAIAALSDGATRRLVLVEGTSDKFWQIACEEASVTVTYGRNGTAGQTRTKQYETPELARRTADAQVAAKLAKGYTEVQTSAVATSSPRDDGTAFLLETAQDSIRPGFRPLDEALESLLELADDPEVGLTRAEAEAVVRQVWDERQAELADGRPGDDVRVEAAFQALRRAGYVAEMDVGMTMSDGWDDFGDQVQASPTGGLVFFHGQDSARLAFSPATLYVAFDCVSGADADMVAVGQAAVDALEAQGLDVEWTGSRDARIVVKDLDWRRPLPGPVVAPPAPARRGFFARFRR